MNIKIRNAVPDDAAAIQKIIAAGYRRSFAIKTPPNRAVILLA